MLPSSIISVMGFVAGFAWGISIGLDIEEKYINDDDDGLTEEEEAVFEDYYDGEITEEELEEELAEINDWSDGISFVKRDYCA